MSDAPSLRESPPQRLIYAVGDIHGRLDLLLLAADAIETHLAGRLGEVIFLGDYVDRGPDSRGVVEFLMRAQSEGGATCLKGNHEDLMVSACDGENVDLWMVNGGGATVDSYGGKVDPLHVEWMRRLPVIAHDGHRVYVHAGVAPKVSLEDQDDATCMWIRDKFLRAHAEDLPAHIVHGHTPVHAGKPDASKPECLRHRTNLDTAAFFTDVLTVGVFDQDTPGGPVELISVTSRKDGASQQIPPSNG